MLRLMMAALAAWAIAGTAQAGDALTSEKTYTTHCFPWDSSYRLDDHYLYRSSGDGAPFLWRLDLLSGQCDHLVRLPTNTFTPVAVSGTYVVANDGIYNRLSVYTKADWQRHGSLRLAEAAGPGVIRGDRLYLFQDKIVSPSRDHRLVLTVFSLPDLKRIETRDYPDLLEDVGLTADGFTTWHGGKLTYRRFDGGPERTLDLPYIQGEGVSIDEEGREFTDPGCPVGSQVLNDDVALVTRSCTSYYVVDLKAMAVRSQVNLPKHVLYGEGVAEGSRLYLIEKIPGQPPYYKARQKMQVQVFNLADGSEAGSGPVLEWSNSYGRYHVGHRLVWVDEDIGKTNVTIYGFQP
ncbi:hypothetical protein [Asticcacaulis solisilvae]|uniref:hypothetical protein n=1 Tax=Asticcacaulis solisilvae TaxID=1217274 RepID=UPI003FD85584